MISYSTYIKKEDGAALIIAIIIVSILTFLIMDFNYSVRVNIRKSTNLRDETKAYWLAKGGINQALLLLKTTIPSETYHHLDQPWAKAFRIETEQGIIDVSIVDENSKINLNMIVTPSRSAKNIIYIPKFERGFLLCGIPLERIPVIVDWIDSNNVPEYSGAENSYYMGLIPPYKCKNNFLDSLYELVLLKDFKIDDIAKLQDVFTVYPYKQGETYININTVQDPRIFQIISAGREYEIDSYLAEAIIRNRRENGPFRRKEEIKRVDEARMSKIYPGIFPLIDVKSRFFKIFSSAIISHEGANIPPVKLTLKVLVEIDGKGKVIVHRMERGG